VIDLIAQTVHPEHLLTDAYIFKHRDEYLKSVLGYIALVAKDAKKEKEYARGRCLLLLFIHFLFPSS
jgi:hypothetical protein